MQAAAKNLSSHINHLVQSNSTGWNTTSFSITLFTSSEDSFAYEYHRTASSVLQSDAGVKNVTADSVYRIASISKLMSVYLFLIQLGGHHLHTPISRFIPELLIYTNASVDDVEAVRPDWRDVTIADLASYLSGLPNDRESFRELSRQSTLTQNLIVAYDISIPVPGAQFEMIRNETRGIFPQLPNDEVPSCGFDSGSGFVACSNEGMPRSQTAN
jgi:hypothetical protein